MRKRPSGERLGLGERLVAARERRGLRQLDVAREIGVRRETIARIEIDHIAGEAVRARVRGWLEVEEAKEAEEKAAGDDADRRKAAERAARGRERRAVVQRVGRARLRRLGRLAVRRRAKRAFEAAEAEGKKKRGKKRRG